MLRRIVSNFYRRLPVVRELQAVVSEHQKITVRSCTSRITSRALRINLFENHLRPSQTDRLLDIDLRDHPRYGDPLTIALLPVTGVLTKRGGRNYP